MSNLFERLGGAPAIHAVVDTFYEAVLSDERTRRFFDDVDMARQKGKQRAFLAFAFGGPVKYTGQDMRQGHAHLIERGLGDAEVDAVIELLGGALRRHGVAESDIAEVAAIAESVRDDVLNR